MCFGVDSGIRGCARLLQRPPLWILEMMLFRLSRVDCKADVTRLNSNRFLSSAEEHFTSLHSPSFQLFAGKCQSNLAENIMCTMNLRAWEVARPARASQVAMASSITLVHGGQNDQACVAAINSAHGEGSDGLASLLPVD